MRRFTKIMKIKNRDEKEEKATILLKWLARKNYTTKRDFYENPFMRYLEEIDKIPFFSNLNMKLFRESGFELLERDLQLFEERIVVKEYVG